MNLSPSVARAFSFVALTVGLAASSIRSASAFEFQPSDFAVMYDEEAEKEGRASRIRMVSCDQAAPYTCEYGLQAGSSRIAVLASRDRDHTKTIAFLISTDTLADRQLFQDAPFILTALLSPSASDADRKAVVDQLYPSDLAKAVAEQRAVPVGHVRYVSGALPGLIWTLGAQDQRDQP